MALASQEPDFQHKVCGHFTSIGSLFHSGLEDAKSGPGGKDIGIGSSVEVIGEGGTVARGHVGALPDSSGHWLVQCHTQQRGSLTRVSATTLRFVSSYVPTLGSGVEVLHDGMWYSGYVVAMPIDDANQQNRWTVQCHEDSEGMFTYTDENAMRPLLSNEEKAVVQSALSRERTDDEVARAAKQARRDAKIVTREEAVAEAARKSVEAAGKEQRFKLRFYDNGLQDFYETFLEHGYDSFEMMQDVHDTDLTSLGFGSSHIHKFHEAFPRGSAYTIDNSQLKSNAPGLGYRDAKSFDQAAQVFAGWGSKVVGVDQNDGWLKVGLRYLPTELEGVRVAVAIEEGSPAQSDLQATSTLLPVPSEPVAVARSVVPALSYPEAAPTTLPQSPSKLLAGAAATIPFMAKAVAEESTSIPAASTPAPAALAKGCVTEVPSPTMPRNFCSAPKVAPEAPGVSEPVAVCSSLQHLSGLGHERSTSPAAAPDPNLKRTFARPAAMTRLPAGAGVVHKSPQTSPRNIGVVKTSPKTSPRIPEVEAGRPTTESTAPEKTDAVYRIKAAIGKYAVAVAYFKRYESTGKLWERGITYGFVHWKERHCSEHMLVDVSQQAKAAFEAEVEGGVTPESLARALGCALTRFLLVDKFRLHVASTVTTALKQLGKDSSIETAPTGASREYHEACQAAVLKGAVTDLQKWKLLPDLLTEAYTPTSTSSGVAPNWATTAKADGTSGASANDAFYASDFDDAASSTSTVAAGAPQGKTLQSALAPTSPSAWNTIAGDFDDAASMASTVDAGPAATKTSEPRAAQAPSPGAWDAIAADFDDTASNASTVAAGLPPLKTAETSLAEVLASRRPRGTSPAAATATEGWWPWSSG